MARIRIRAFFASVLLSISLAAPAPLVLSAATAQQGTPVAGNVGEGPVLLFAAPGMRTDLIETFAAEGAVPSMADMLETGARASGGLLNPFPATTGVSLSTLLTGT